MSTSLSSEQEFQGMMKHLDALYAMAQVLTLDTEEASLLVEDTFKKALQIREKNLLNPGDRRHLLQLLIQVHHEKKQPTPLFDVVVEKPAPVASRESFKKRVLNQFLNRAVPASFAVMDENDRIVLSLCEANRLSNADTALILGGDSDSVSQQLHAARRRLEEMVVANAPPAIREMLKESNPAEWIPQSLRRSLKSDFSTLSPTLEHKIQSAFTRQNPEIAGQALVYTKKQSDPDPRFNLSRGLVAVFLVLTAGFLGYIGSSMLVRDYDANLLTLSASKAPRVETVLSTADLTEAEQFVLQQMHWRLSLPEISGGELTGVGISEIADDVRVPVFLYRDEATPDMPFITVYAFTYALLDEYPDRIQLESDILQAIADEESFDLRDLNEKQKFVIWRNANDIFMAVTSSDPRELRDRITLH